jgi:hypothetical protein
MERRSEGIQRIFIQVEEAIPVTLLKAQANIFVDTTVLGVDRPVKGEGPHCLSE